MLTAMGFRARGRYAPGSDGGVDIIATKDALGLDPERIKVQVKHQRAPAGVRGVQHLGGALLQNERGRFVSLGGFTNDASRQSNGGVRLIDGDAFIDLLLECYNKLNPQMQTRIPLKRVYLPAGNSRPSS